MTATIDDVKKFWNDRPCNVRHSKKETGTKAYFDEVEKKKFFVEPHIKSFSHFNEWNGKKVLEIGCGMACLLYTSPSPRDRTRSRMPSSA